MTGFDILKARKQAKLSQKTVVRALGLKGGRGSLTDIENGNVEVTAVWVQKALAAIDQVAAVEKAA